MGVRQEREGWADKGYLLGSRVTRKEAHSPPRLVWSLCKTPSSPSHAPKGDNVPTNSGQCTTAQWENPELSISLGSWEE